MPTSPKPAPQSGEVWAFYDRLVDGKPVGYYTTGLLFGVTSQTVSWRGVGGCLITLLREKLIERTSRPLRPELSESRLQVSEPSLLKDHCKRLAQDHCKRLAQDDPPNQRAPSQDKCDRAVRFLRDVSPDPSCKACQGTGQAKQKRCGCTYPSPKKCYGCSSPKVVPGSLYCQNCLDLPSATSQ